MPPSGDAISRLTLDHPDGVTPVLVGEDALEIARPELAAWLAGRTAFVVTTARVWALHGDRLGPLSRSAARWVILEVEDGEEAKSVESAERLWNEMLAAGGKRDSRLLAFGGGSVGDLGGFAAGCFLRGIEFVQVPTTLLAQVDAALGGKTGVDLPGGKNTVGLFHHPRWVVSDTAVLATLPREELRSGMVEVVKMAALLDPDLFVLLEERMETLLAGDPATLGPVVTAAAAAKIGVVERDPTEQGDRRLLNFGHTLGHAVESACGYAGLRHGEAVGYGILFALRLALSRGLDRRTAERIHSLILRLGLPPLPELDPEALLAAMARDKKALESGLVWVLPRALGEGWMAGGVPAQEVRAALRSFLRGPFAPPA
ncbi:MAG TPA: 3-dehydroquinate synthase [Thermoanaerobaculia bacterium]|jgi:3-dehydroquinate synthase|nr:3-dehydroquinate synthase [Thermoanaerobaculia bacterium]